MFFFSSFLPFSRKQVVQYFLWHTHARARAFKVFFAAYILHIYITCMGLYGHSAILVSRNGIFKKPEYILKEAKTVLIGSIRNEGKLVGKDHHQFLFSKLKKRTNAFQHQSLFAKPKKVRMCFKLKSLAFGRIIYFKANAVQD